jgi:6-phospho-beta-glucosidase
MVIEVPCQVDGEGPVPLPVPAPTAHQLGLMSVVRASERDVADAALLVSGRLSDLSDLGDLGADARERAGDLALRAFVSHPLVGSLDAARALAAAALPMPFLPTASDSTQLSYRYSSFSLAGLALGAVR